MSNADVSKAMEKLKAVIKSKKEERKSDTKKPGSAKRSDMYNEIFSSPPNTLIRVIASTPGWLVPLFQDAVIECENNRAAPYVAYLEKIFVECRYAPPDSTIKELVETLPVLCSSVIQCINRRGTADSGVVALKLWEFVVKALSAEILSNHEITNTICSVFAHGFKSAKVPIVQQSFISWKSVIEAFAGDPHWVDTNRHGIDKRLELVLRALRHKVTSQASLEIFDTWFYLAESLGPRLSQTFDSVVHGLLRFCVGGETDYLEDIDADGIRQKAAQHLKEGSKLVARISSSLNSIKFSKTALNENVPWMAPKLRILLNAILGDKGAFNAALSNADVLQIHGIFLTQCIRWLSFNVEPSEEEIVLSLPRLWEMLWEKISKLPDDRSRLTELMIFFVQLKSWIKESKHGSQVAIDAVELLCSVGVFDDFAEEYEEIKRLLPWRGTSKKMGTRKSGPIHLSASDADTGATTIGDSEFSVNNEPIRSVLGNSQATAENSDDIFAESPRPSIVAIEKQQHGLQHSDQNDLAASGSPLADSSGALSESIGMSARSIDDILPQCESPVSSLSGTRKAEKSSTSDAASLRFSNKDMDVLFVGPDEIAPEKEIAQDKEISEEGAKQMGQLLGNLNDGTEHGNAQKQPQTPIAATMPTTPIATAISKTPVMTTPTTTGLGREISGRIGTPGILKKVDSPVHPDKKNRRVHFVPDAKETNVIASIELQSSPSRKSARKISLQGQSSESAAQNRKRPWSSFGESVHGVTNSTTEKDADMAANDPLIPLEDMSNSPTEKASTTLTPIPTNLPISLESPLVKRQNKMKSVSPKAATPSAPVVKEPFMPELVNSRESIFLLCKALAPSGCFSNSSLVMHLNSKKIFTVGSFASLSEADISDLPLKKPEKIEKIREIMSKLFLPAPALPTTPAQPIASLWGSTECVGAEESNKENLVGNDGVFEEPHELIDVDEGDEAPVTKIQEQVVEGTMEDSAMGEQDVIEADVADENVVETSMKNGGDLSNDCFSEDIRQIWESFKNAMLWADDSANSFDQASAMRMLMEFQSYGSRIAQKLHAEMSKTSES